MEDQDAWDELLAAGFLHALREAHLEATLAVFGGLSRAAGFKERSFGYTAYDVLETQLDRVFQVGTAARAATRPMGVDGDSLVGLVARDDLNGSPGWRYGRYRILLKRHEFGSVRALRWDRDSPTKQAVARQEFRDDPQIALDLGVEVAPDTPEAINLVLAHSATEEPLEMELYLGRPRWNVDGGSAWHWHRPLSDDTLGADPRRKLVESTPPLWADDEADVAMRLRRPDLQTGTSIETAQ